MTGEVPRSVERGVPAITPEGLEGRAELLFVLLPLFVLALDRAFRLHGLPELLTDTEFSFAAAVLFGQSVAKYVRGAVRRGLDGGRIAYGAVKIIVFGLIPALYTMSWMVDYNTNRQPYESGKFVAVSIFGQDMPLPILAPAIAQLSLCAVGIYVFMRVSAHAGSGRPAADHGVDVPPPVAPA